MRVNGLKDILVLEKNIFNFYEKSFTWNIYESIKLL